MNKQLLYSITAVLLLSVLVAGSTYAFFSASNSSNTNAIATDAYDFEILYSNGNQISGNIPILVDRTGAKSTTVSIRVTNTSAKPLAYIYMSIDEMTSNLSISGFKWAVVGVKNGQTVYTDEGSFNGYNDTTNNLLTLVSDYRLDTQSTDFTIYFWLDGDMIDNNIFGASFDGYIWAKTENYTAVLE